MTTRPLPDWPRGMSVDLAAAYVGLSATTIRACAGFPAPVRLTPGRLAYLREDLDSWLDGKAGRGAGTGTEPNPWD